jgi:uncharacterized cupredoxin-like copper-binding protein
VILALTTEHKVLLAGMGAIFIAFALGSALVVPRIRPDFPGERGRRPFVVASIVLFVAMMLAVEFFAVEEEEGEAHAGATAQIDVSAREFEFDFTGGGGGVEPGRHVFRLVNSGQSGHNLVIEGPGIKRKATPIIEPGKSAELAANLQRGEYTLYCSVPGHRDAGMETKLDVG